MLVWNFIIISEHSIWWRSTGITASLSLMHHVGTLGRNPSRLLSVTHRFPCTGYFLYLYAIFQIRLLMLVIVVATESSRARKSAVSSFYNDMRMQSHCDSQQSSIDELFLGIQHHNKCRRRPVLNFFLFIVEVTRMFLPSSFAHCTRFIIYVDFTNVSREIIYPAASSFIFFFFTLLQTFCSWCDIRVVGNISQDICQAGISHLHGGREWTRVCQIYHNKWDYGFSCQDNVVTHVHSLLGSVAISLCCLLPYYA